MGHSDSSKPPLWLVFVVQLVSVVGDQLGQRASRFDFSSSSRRMLIALTAVSSTQIFLVLGTLQLALSSSVTGAIYEDGHKVQCFREVDLDGHKPSYCEGRDVARCTPIDCPSQGPFSMPRSIGLHPLLMLNGFINISYYVGEVMLYHHPLGLVLIVIAALAASFIIQPMEGLFGLETSQAIPGAVIALGVLGSLFCVVEKQVKASVRLRVVYAQWKAALLFRDPPPQPMASLADGEEDFGSAGTAGKPLAGGKREAATAAAAASADSADADAYRPVRDDDPSEGELDLSPAGPVTACDRFAGAMRVFLPFTALSIAYGMWFVSQKAFNDDYRTNVFGYTSIDQVLAPFFMLPFLLVVDQVGALRRQCVPVEERHQDFFAACRSTVKQLFAHRGRGLGTVFLYRLLINARAMAYFYLSVQYDLAAVYLELTLVRIILSWVMALFVCVLAPGFIGLGKAEQNTIFHPANLVLKFVGTGLIIGALFLLDN